MPIQSTLAGSLSLPSASAIEPALKYLKMLSPRTRLFLASGVLLALVNRYLRAKSARRASGGGYYVEDLSEVRLIEMSPITTHNLDRLEAPASSRTCGIHTM